MPENGDLPARPEDRPDKPGLPTGAGRASAHHQGGALPDRARAAPEVPEATHGAGEDFSKTMTFTSVRVPNSPHEDSYLTRAATDLPPVATVIIPAVPEGADPSRLGR